RGQEGVGVADHRPDVQVVAPVLDGDVERVPPGVEVGDDRLDPPVPVAVDDVAAVAPGQQLRVEPGVVRARVGVRPDTDGRVALRCRTLGARGPRSPVQGAAPDVPPAVSVGASDGAEPGPMPSCSRIWASRAWASVFIAACSTSSIRLSTELSVSSAMPLARA